MAILAVLIGITAGALSGLIGLGGGVLLVPALVYLFRMSQHEAQGTSLATLLLPIGLFAPGAHVRGLLEDDGFVVIEEDSVFNVQANGAGEDHFFKVAPLFHQIFNGIAMRDASDTLFNDGAVVEDFGDIVRGGADEFYAALIGLVMGFRADEGG